MESPIAYSSFVSPPFPSIHHSSFASGKMLVTMRKYCNLGKMVLDDLFGARLFAQMYAVIQKEIQQIVQNFTLQ